MQHHTDSFTGLHDTPIFTQGWLPDDPPRAAVVVAHGLSEHSGRYAHVAARLVEHGFAVYVLDHRGHGQSGGARSEIGRFEDFVDDLRAYVAQVRGALPVFLYGHSMGSLVSLMFAAQYPDDLAGLITTGTALHTVRGATLTALLIRALADVAPNVRLARLNPRWVSRDPAVVQRYRDDPLNYHGALSFHTVAELQRAAAEGLRVLPSLRLPYLALHGGADPLCFPSGAEEIRRRCSPERTQVKVYDGLYHEIHNEPEQDQVIADIVAWLEAHVPPS